MGPYSEMVHGYRRIPDWGIQALSYIKVIADITSPLPPISHTSAVTIRRTE